MEAAPFSPDTIDARAAAAVRFDAAALRAWIAAAAGEGPIERLQRDLARAWCAVAEGEPAPDVMAVLARAEAAADGALLAEAAALAALATEDAAQGLALARRASRAAQETQAPFAQQLASLVLARLRRLTGRPHLALHIVSALEAAAVPALRGWLDWERVLAGGDARGDAPTPLAGAAAAAAALVATARAGDPAGFQAAASTLARLRPAPRPFARECDALPSVLEPARALPDDPAVVAWASGRTTATPFGLHALGGGGDPSEETITAYAVSDPGQRGRRVLRAGVGLQPATPLALDEPDAGASGPRTDTALAVLALAGPDGLKREDFFRAVYGFTFVTRRHQGVLDVLVRRMRVRLGDAGEIDRRDDLSVALSLRTAIAVPDARCVLSLGERVLRALAAGGASSAQQAAEIVRAPLRTVQAALQQLVQDGACAAERLGRQILYRVEDTTFTPVRRPGG